MRVRITKRFTRSITRIPSIKTRAAKALIQFRENPNHPGLNFERLSGREDAYSIRVTRKYRILLIRETDEDGELYAADDIGSHQIYRR